MTSTTEAVPGPAATASITSTASPRQPWEAEMLELLTGPGAEEPLGLAVATLRVELSGHEVHSVQHRPGDGVTVGYRVWLLHDSGELVEDYVLLSSTAGRDVPDDAQHVVSIEGPSGRLLGWRHPHDPALPGLGTACDPLALEDVLPGDGPVTSIELIGYRPLRRAVVRAVRDGGTAYVKVLRPAAGRGGAPDVVRRLTLLADAGLPVPRILVARDDGLVALDQAVGTPLVMAIGLDAARGIDVDDLVALLDALPPAVLELPRRHAWSDRAPDYADAVSAAGVDGRRALDLGRGVRERSRRVDLGPVVPTHGDFHEGQLTVVRAGDGWRPSGLLDVDTVGPGHRVDDVACLVAHAIALGPAGHATAARWEQQARGVVDASALDVRTAGVLLSLAAGAVHEGGLAMPTAALLDAAEARLSRTP